MLRLTFKRDDADDDTVEWNARVRDAVPASMFVAAFLDATMLEIYVDIDPRDDGERAIRNIVDALGLGECRMCSVAPLARASEAQHPAVAAQPRLAHLHPARIVAVDVGQDERSLTARVRHARYERVDRVDVMETDDTVELSAWVGREEDDPRADYATLAHTFSNVTTKLSRPLGERRIVYAIG